MLIGAAASSGGGGSTTTIEDASLVRVDPEREPFGNSTPIWFSASHPAGRPIWIQLGYQVADGPSGVIPPSDIDLIDPATDQSVSADQFLDKFDGARWRELPTTAGGREYRLRWRHRDTLGGLQSQRNEYRSVTVNVAFGDEEDTARTVGTVAVLPQKTIGQRLGEVSGVRIATNATGSDGKIRVEASYEDFAGDGAATIFQLDYSLDGGSTWVEVRNARTPDGQAMYTATTSFTANPLPTAASDKVSYALAFEIDPLDPGTLIPTASLTGFVARVRALGETVPGPYRAGGSIELFRRFTLSSGPGAAGTLDVGVAPTIETIDVRNPGFEGNRRPWFESPIKLKINNGTARDLTVDITGRYRVTNFSEPFAEMTFGSDAPGFENRVTVPANGSITTFVLWDVRADEGLGLGSRSESADFELRTEVVLPAGIVGQRLVSAYVNNGGSELLLSTNPFTNFPTVLRENGTNTVLDARHVVSGRRLNSSGQPGLPGSPTLDLFYARAVQSTKGVPGVGQERILGADQQFSPLPIFDPDEHPFSRTFVGFITPTDLVPGRPDCLVGEGQRVHFVQWAADGTVSPEEQQDRLIGSQFTTQEDKLGERVVFKQRSGGPDVEAALRVQFDEENSGGQLFQRIIPNVFIADPSRPSNDVWRVQVPEQGDPNYTDFRRQIPSAAATRNGSFRSVLGEFDDDPYTVDFLVINRRAELRGPNDPEGWHSILRFELMPNGEVDFKTPIDIPSPTVIQRPLSSAPTSTTTSQWILRLLPTDRDDRPGLILVRIWEDDGVYDREFSVDVLHQRGGMAGSFAGQSGFNGRSWEPLAFEGSTCAPRDPANNPADLGILCASAIPGLTDTPVNSELLVADLDGDGLADPIIIFTNRGNPVVSLTAMLLANRRNRTSIWRPAIDGLRLDGNGSMNEAFRAVDPNSGTFRDISGGGAERVDLNGDDALDLVLVATTDNSSPIVDDWGRLFYSAAQTGVAGDLSDFVPNASQSPSALPGVADVTGDGFVDLISRGAIYRGQPNGAFEFVSGLGPVSVPANIATTSTRLSQIFDLGTSREGEIDWLLFNRDERDRREFNRVLTLCGIGTNTLTLENPVDIDLRDPAVNGMAIVDARPFVTVGGVDQELALVLEADGARLAPKELWRFRASGGAFRPVGTTPLADQIAALGGRSDGLLATVRRGPMNSSTLIRNSIPQDLAVPRQVSPPELTVFDSSASYAPISIVARPELPVPTVDNQLRGASIEGVAAAEATGDDLEDLLVLMRSGRTLRVFKIAQDPAVGFGGSPSITKILEFQEPATEGPSANVFGFGFDRDAQRYGTGIVITGTQVRFMLPDAGRMIRSDIPRARLGMFAPFSLVLRDLDNDGQVDVLGGQDGGAGLLRVDRGIRRQSADR